MWNSMSLPASAFGGVLRWFPNATRVHEDPRLDALSAKFASWARAANGRSLDIGCGDGCATAAALEQGARILAVDSDPGAMRRLMGRIPSGQRSRLQTQAGQLPEIDFRIGSFSGVHAARVLHALDGAAIEDSLRKFFRWVYPDGKLFISALTPAGSFWKPFRSQFARRVAAGIRWPGYIDDVAAFFPDSARGAQPVHLLDEEILRRELDAAGFVVEEVSGYTLPWDSDQQCCAIRARCSG
jgi:SAM-dependent methyltransferase